MPSILFVFSWLVVGGEETEVRLLAQKLDPARFRLEVVACLRRDGMPDQTERQLRALGVPVDVAPYRLSFEDTVDHLAGRVSDFDVVVACQAVPDIVPALELAASRGLRVPPLIEHGGLVQEAERASHLAARYVGVCESIRAAAARNMPGREADALEIPSMVDLDAFDPEDRAGVRAELRLADHEVAFAWVGRLDRKKRVEDFLHAAAILRATQSHARFVVIGGPDAFMPEYALDLRSLAEDLELAGSVQFLGDREDVPRLLAGMDAMVWLARGEGMPHVIAEAGAAALPVIATRDNGTLEQIRDGETGIFVPHQDPSAVAAMMDRLATDEPLRRRLGGAFREDVEARFSAAVVVPRWERLFEEVIAEATEREGRSMVASAVPVTSPRG
jgi:glycosyltransferase involved in cell wall biosynthesis